jgi:hypothetical protein
MDSLLAVRKRIIFIIRPDTKKEKALLALSSDFWNFDNKFYKKILKKTYRVNLN